MEFILKVRQNHIFQLLYSKRKYLLYGSLFFLLLCIIPIKNAHASVAGWIIENTLGVIILWIVDALAYILDQLAGVVAYIMNATDVSEVPAITESWKVVRDGVNITFIAVLLVAGVFNIIHYEPDTYALKEYMPNFVIAVIGVNFSKVMCLFILDFVNVLTASIYTFIGGAGKPMSGNEGLGMYGQNIGYVVKNLLRWDNAGSTSFYDRTVSPNGGSTLAGAMGSAETSKEVFSSWDQTIKVFLVIISLVVLILVFLQLIGVFFVRLIKLWVLIAVSPLFFMGLSSSFLSSISDSWWESFWKYASIPIKVSAFISMGLLLAQKINESALSGTSMLANNEALIGQTGADGVVSMVTINSLVSYLILVGIVVGTLYAALDAASDDGPGSKIGEYLQKPFRGLGSFAGSVAMAAPLIPSLGLLKFTGIGWLQGKMAKSDNKWVKKFGDRGPLGTLGRLANKSPMFGSVRAYKVAGETIAKAIEGQVNSHAEDVGGSIAVGSYGVLADLSNAFSANAFGRKIGGNGMFSTDKVKMRIDLENRKSTDHRAHEMEEGLKNLDGHALETQLKSASNEDEIKAVIGALGHHGEFHGQNLEKIARNMGFENSQEYLAHLNDKFDEKFYGTHAVQASMNALKQNVGNYEYLNKERLSDLGSVIPQLIERLEGHDTSIDRAELLSAIQVAIKSGKSDPHQLASYVARANDSGILSVSDLGILQDLVGDATYIEGIEDINKVTEKIKQHGIDKDEMTNKFRTDSANGVTMDNDYFNNYFVSQGMSDDGARSVTRLLQKKGNLNAYIRTQSHLARIKNLDSMSEEEIFQEYGEFLGYLNEMEAVANRNAKAMPKDPDHSGVLNAYKVPEDNLRNHQKISGRDETSGMFKSNAISGALHAGATAVSTQQRLNALGNGLQRITIDRNESAHNSSYVSDSRKRRQQEISIDSNNYGNKFVSADMEDQANLKAMDIYMRTPGSTDTRAAAASRFLLEFEHVARNATSIDQYTDINQMNSQFSPEFQGISI
jgi:hypothetical protein